MQYSNAIFRIYAYLVSTRKNARKHRECKFTTWSCRSPSLMDDVYPGVDDFFLNYAGSRSSRKDATITSTWLSMKSIKPMRSSSRVSSRMCANSPYGYPNGRRWTEKNNRMEVDPKADAILPVHPAFPGSAGMVHIRAQVRNGSRKPIVPLGGAMNLTRNLECTHAPECCPRRATFSPMQGQL